MKALSSLPFLTAGLFLSFFVSFFVNPSNGLSSTDTITWGGSNDRSGYQNNHNMDPSIVGSAQFGLLFKTLLPGTYLINGQNVPEQIFSQPLVYTGSEGIQYLYVATTQNNIYKIVAKTGVIVASRNLHRPFLVSDLAGCVDINPTIGVTATGVIDPNTDTWYITAKTYLDQSLDGPIGPPNGRYYVHAVSTVDLTERANFPVDLEGMVARNNPVRSFNGGIHHQRPALLHTGDYIYAGFASHCVQWNFTGWIVGWHKGTGQLVERFATEGAGVGPNVPGGGVWMSGGGLASDDRGSMFFASGNGYASQLDSIPVNGRNPPTALEEAAVHMSINQDGSLTVVDFFMPWEKKQLDGADKDLGTSPLQILPSQFSCGEVKRMGVVTGKSGKTYWLNLDDLGGYKNGPNRLDRVVQVEQNENSVYSGAGVYPLEGGYIYINVIQYETHVFKFSCNNGVPYFNKVANSPEKNAYILGVGHGTVTSLQDQPGTGLLWTSDVEGSNLRIYNAVPNGPVLNEIKSFVTPGTTKFTRPVFGDGIVYQGTTQGFIYAYGSPVNLPLNCTSLQFGTVNLNTTSSSLTVQCRAKTALTIIGANLSGNPNFAIHGLPAFPINLARDQSFSFLSTFTPRQVGPLSSSIVLNTTQQAAGYSINTPIQLRGTGQSEAPLLMATPNTVTWNGVITGQQAGGVNQSLILSNVGNGLLTVTNIKYSVTSETGPWEAFNVTTERSTISAFTFHGMPSSIAPQSAVTVPINFEPPTSGTYGVFIQVVSNGGTKVIDVLATGSDEPKAMLEFQSPNGAWTLYDNTTAFSFGNVTENTSRYLKLRLTNNGTKDAAALSVTVSKPPFGIPGSLIGANNQVDLAEGTLLYSGQNMTATMFCSVPKSQINVDPYNGTATWTMNLNDPSFGKQFIRFFCNAVSEQAPPLNQLTQQGMFRYAGCFKENNPGRQLQTAVYTGSQNTNEKCIAACSAAGYIFAGTQYNQECWCGYNRPKLVTSENNCNFPCTGNVNQICGGNGVNGAGSYISLFGDTSRWNGNTTDTPGPYVNPGTLGFSSLGCYTEATNGRALSVQMNANNTVAGCLQVCQGYTYSGVEYGGQCFCGNTIGAGSISTGSSECGMTCNNNQTEYCGGPSRLNMYVRGNGTGPPPANPSPDPGTQTPPDGRSGLSLPSQILNFTSQSCYTEATVGRALSSFALADSSITLRTCASNCTQYQYFGVEYGRECYCGDVLGSGSGPVTDGRCNMPCAGNASQVCGGPNGLTLYKNLNFTSNPSTPSNPPVSTGPSVLPNVGSWQYVDCHTEVPGRALTGKGIATNDMTIQNCAGNCTGFSFFGVEYARECYCGNTVSGGSVTATDGRCNMACAGDSSLICGGPNGLSFYQFVAASSSSSISLKTSTSTMSGISSSFSTSTSTRQFTSTTSTSATTASFSASGSVTGFSTSIRVSSSSYSQSTTSALPGSSLSGNPSSYMTSRRSESSSSSSSILFWTTSSIANISRNGTVPPSSISTTTGVSTVMMMTTTTSRPIPLSSASATVNPSTAQSVLSSQVTATTPPTATSTGRIISISQAPSSSLSTSSKMTSTSVSATLASSTISQMSSTTSVTSTSNSYVALISTTSPTLMGTTNTKNGDPTSSSGSPSASSTTSSAIPGTIRTSTTTFTATTLSTATTPNKQSSSASVTTTISPNPSLTTTMSQPTMVTSRSSTLPPSSGSTTTTTSPTATPTANTYTSLGCASEASNGRLLPSLSTTSNAMTPQYCQSFCTGNNYAFSGVEFGRECYCSATLPRDTAFNATGCSMGCAGDAAQTCGGRSRLNVYRNAAVAVPGTKSPIAGYAYVGCYTDPSAAARLLAGFSFSNASMTQPLCVSTCRARGFAYAGVEYGRECYCGDKLNTAQNGGSGARAASETECGMLCAGDRSEFCGDGARIGVWSVVVQD